MKKILLQFHNDRWSQEPSWESVAETTNIPAMPIDPETDNPIDESVFSQAPNPQESQNYVWDSVSSHTDSLNELRKLSQEIYQNAQNLERQVYLQWNIPSGVMVQQPYDTPREPLITKKNIDQIVASLPQNMKDKVSNIDAKDASYLIDLMKTPDWNKNTNLKKNIDEIQSNIKILESAKTYSQDPDFQNFLTNLINNQKRIFNAINSRILNLATTRTNTASASWFEKVDSSLEAKKNQLIKDLMDLRIESINLFNLILKDKTFTKIEAQKYKPQAKAMFDKFSAIESMLDKKENKDLRDLILWVKDTTNNNRKDSPADNLNYVWNNIDAILNKINLTINPSLSTTTSWVESGKIWPKSVAELQSLLNRFWERYVMQTVLADMRKMWRYAYENFSYSWLTSCAWNKEWQCVNFIRNRVPAFPLSLWQFQYSKKIKAVKDYWESPVPVAGSIVVMPNIPYLGDWAQPWHIGLCIGPWAKPNTYRIVQSNWITPWRVKVVDMPYERWTRSARGVIAYATRAIWRENPYNIVKDIRAWKSPYA